MGILLRTIMILFGMLTSGLPAHATGHGEAAGHEQAADHGSMLDHAKSKLHGSDHQPEQSLRAFGEDFDPDQALKTSQAAVGSTPSNHTFLDRNGRPVSLNDFRGKPLVISLIYTSCFHICPTTTQSLAKASGVAESAVGQDKYNVVTIGFDTNYDKPERMTSYARQQGMAMKDNWKFLSTDEHTIHQLSEELGFIFVPSPKGFDHLIQTTILDAEGKVYRQIYGMEFDPAHLTGAMKELVFGTTPATLDLSYIVNRAKLFCTIYDPTTGTYRFNFAMIFGMIVGAFTLSLTGYFVVRFVRKA